VYTIWKKECVIVNTGAFEVERKKTWIEGTFTAPLATLSYVGDGTDRI
jgi:hypothetical protein